MTKHMMIQGTVPKGKLLQGLTTNPKKTYSLYRIEILQNIVIIF